MAERAQPASVHDDLPPHVVAVLDDVFFRRAHWHSAYEVGVQRLAQAIKLGALSVGAQLPPERELVERLGVSRTTLREAIRALQQQGYLKTRRGRSGGTFVASRQIRQLSRGRGREDRPGPRPHAPGPPGYARGRRAVRRRARRRTRHRRAGRGARDGSSIGHGRPPFRRSVRPTPRCTSRWPTRRAPTSSSTSSSRNRCASTRSWPSCRSSRTTADRVRRSTRQHAARRRGHRRPERRRRAPGHGGARRVDPTRRPRPAAAAGRPPGRDDPPSYSYTDVVTGTSPRSRPAARISRSARSRASRRSAGSSGTVVTRLSA